MESGKPGRGLRLRVERGVLSGEVEAALSKQGLGLTGDLDGRQAEAETIRRSLHPCDLINYLPKLPSPNTITLR